MTTPSQRTDPEFDFAPFAIHKPATGRTIDIVKFVLGVWKPVAVGLLLGLLVGIGVYVYLGPVYSASTQVLVSRKASAFDGGKDINLSGGRTEHLRLIQTDLIVERAFKDHGLSKIPGLAGAYDPLKNVSEGLNVSRSAGQDSSFDNILTIAYLHPDKKIASQVVQAVVESYRDYLTDTRDENSKQLYETLFNQRTELETQIATLEADHQRFRKEAPVYIKSAPVVTINGTPTAAPSQQEVTLQAIETARDENRRQRSAIQARIATLDKMLADANKSREELEFWVVHALSTGTGTRGAGSGGGGALAGPPAKAHLDQQLLTARLLEQRLLLTLGEGHAAVRNVRSQVDTILQFYRQQGLTPPNLPSADRMKQSTLGVDMVSVYRTTLDEQLAELDIDDENLNIQYQDAVTKAKEASLFEIEDQRRKDEISQQKQQLKQLQDTIAAFDVSKEQEGYRLKQISQVRIERSLMRVAKIVGAFGILGAGLVFVLAYFREWYDSSLKTLDEVRQFTGGEILGSVPKFAPSPDADRQAAETGIAPVVCYYHRPGSREAESFRSIRTTLFFRMEQGHQVVQVSSAQPGDGKSTAASNLAVAIAQSGKKVLLIDGDLRRPTQHSIFGVPQDIGLTDVLLREIAWENAVRPLKVERLSLMTAGLCPDNPAELLSTEALPQLLKSVRKEYDVVIVDSPPILAVSDPCIVAPHVDGLLLVVRMEKNKRASIDRVRETLVSHGVKLYGVVANDVKAATANDEGMGYDSYSSYYTSEASPSPHSRRRSTPSSIPSGLMSDG